MSDIKHEVYIGDGLYLKYDGFAVWLRAPRELGDHQVALEPQVMRAFILEAMTIPRHADIIKRAVEDAERMLDE